MSEHHDVLEFLNEHLPIHDKLVAMHRSVQGSFPFIARIAVALYDPKTNILKTFLHSSGEDNPLDHYQASLDDAPSLKTILDEGLPRVVNNQLTVESGDSHHTKRMGRQGYEASYTLPMFDGGIFVGFMFFNSYEADVFSEAVLCQMDVYAHMISLIVIHEISAVKTLAAAVRSAERITHVRDPETGRHLDRMSHYSRLIARSLADQYGLDDHYIEHIFMFSPLHDIGKIGIPDRILLKAGKLDEEERRIMRTHVRKGREIIDGFLADFHLQDVEHIDMLRNIAERHHEAVDGSGYPDGERGDGIPLEARIVAVADVFDALTSERSYKKIWSNDQAITMLHELAGQTLDKDCVDALIKELGEVEVIQEMFR
ncbi:MAG: HD domain-containing protein [Gammaproteobacteria bacterium]|nr:HD domain-containing protein [Gammaproteobacteria bacterium]